MENPITQNDVQPQDDELSEELHKKAEYPSACLVLESCIQDYQRIQESYDKIYEKINIALAFAGIILTIMFGSFDFSSAELNVKDMEVWQLMITCVELLCLIGSVILLIGSIIFLLTLLRGKKIAVFKSEDIRNFEVYRQKDSHAAVWLIDKYTKIVHGMRPIVQEKQVSFNKALTVIIIAMILYAISAVLSKGGF